jgi:hypothetical protein
VLLLALDVMPGVDGRRVGNLPYGRGLLDANDEMIRCVSDDRLDEGTDCALDVDDMSIV